MTSAAVVGAPARQSDVVRLQDVPGRTPGPARRLPIARPVVEWTAFSITFGVLVLYVLPARGGWQPGIVPVASVITFFCLLLLRPWHRCSLPVVALAGAPALASFLVGVVTAWGDAGPISLSRWGYASAVLLATAAFARTPRRRRAVVAALLVAGLLQFAEGWIAWWGGGGAVRGPMVGTLYSANPFGGLMAAFAVLGAVVAATGHSRSVSPAWILAPVSVVAVFASGARAALLLVVAGALVSGCVAWRAARWGGLARVAALVALSWLAVLTSTSSLFFPGGGGAFGSVADKEAAGQTLGSTSHVRLDFWAAAWREFADNPFVGPGAGAYGGNSRVHMADGAELSAFTHNEPLGALAEGGLLLGLPVLAFFTVAVVVFGRALLGALRGGDRNDASMCAVALFGGVLLAHSLLDLTLSFPAVLALLAVCVGLVVPTNAPGFSKRPGRRVRRTAVVALCAAAVLGGGLYLGHSHDRNGVGRVSGSELHDSGASFVESPPLPPLRDGRLVVARGRAAVDPRGAVEPALLASLHEELLRLGDKDAFVRKLRVGLLARQGKSEEAMRQAFDLARDERRRAPHFLGPYAELLAAQGRRAEAFDVIAVEVYRRTGQFGFRSDPSVQLLKQALEIAGASEPGWSCTRSAMRRAGVRLPGRAGPPVIDVSSDLCAAWADKAGSLLGASE